MTNRATLPSGVTVHPPGPKRRHWSRVVASSVDLDRLRRLDTLAVDDDHMPSLVASACGELGVPVPLLRFHARRSPYTGACEHPRAYWV
ncbi:MAG: hypothetical protein KDB69_00195, partial [Acidimicrobiia bacterium]|nr:hypothetical protein [Acidimicrobiia bacterium]